MRIDQPTFAPGGLNTVQSSSFASTSSFLNPLNQNVTLTGSLRISGSIIMTGSFNVSGSITGSLFGTSSVALKTIRPTVGLQWANSYGNNVYLNPTSLGGNLAGNSVFLNSAAGVRLTTTTPGQKGTIWWNLSGSGVTSSFDFTNDFRGTFMTFFDGIVNSTAGDGHFFNFGGNGASSTNLAIADNSLSISYDPYSTVMNVRTWINGTIVGSQPLFDSGQISQRWVQWTIDVQRNLTNGRRELSITCNNTLQAVVDVSSWNPAGNIFSVGAWTGGAFCNQYVYQAKLEYI